MQQHRCDECGAVFQTHLALHGHQQVYHPDADSVIAGQALRFGPPVTHRCAFCGQGFEDVQGLRDHIEADHRAERDQRACELKERAKAQGTGGRRRGRRKTAAVEAA